MNLIELLGIYIISIILAFISMYCLWLLVSIVRDFFIKKQRNYSRYYPDDRFNDSNIPIYSVNNFKQIQDIIKYPKYFCFRIGNFFHAPIGRYCIGNNMRKPQGKRSDTNHPQDIENIGVLSSHHAVDSSTGEKDESTKNEPNPCYCKIGNHPYDIIVIVNLARINRHVKIVCTMGPSSSSPEIIEQMLLRGMDIARFNLAYGTFEEHSERISLVRSLSQSLKLPTGILMDLPGPKRLSGNIKAMFGQHLDFVISQNADFIALSFISSAKQVEDVRRLLTDMNSSIPVIVKIERLKALEEIENILNVCEGIMVARGDLALDISIEKVPLAQKHLISAANRRGKPVITATQMLESMVRSVLPSRAEATDVANAVLDGTDAVMLSEETSIGKYPAQSTEMMAKIALEVESEFPYLNKLTEKWPVILPEVNDATARAACQMAHQVQAKAIIAFTTGGTTALRVSKYRPAQPILAITPYESVMTRLSVAWGVIPITKPVPSNLEGIFGLASEAVLEMGLVKKGDLVVLTAGLPLSMPGSTNLVKIHSI